MLLSRRSFRIEPKKGKFCSGKIRENFKLIAILTSQRIEPTWCKQLQLHQDTEYAPSGSASSYAFACDSFYRTLWNTKEKTGETNERNRNLIIIQVLILSKLETQRHQETPCKVLRREHSAKRIICSNAIAANRNSMVWNSRTYTSAKLWFAKQSVEK